MGERTGRERPRYTGSFLRSHNELGFHLLSYIRAGDVGYAFAFLFVFERTVRGEPLLAAGEEFVEASLLHRSREVRVAAKGDEPANRLALLNGDLAFARVEFEHRMPRVACRVPVGFDDGRHRPPRSRRHVGHFRHQQDFIWIGLQIQERADLHLVTDLFVDVVADDVRDGLPLLPEPRVLLRERSAFGFFGG